ncbi:MAG: hypothetical protein RSA90_07720 [Lachnospiraceae bacterium]
MTSHNIKMSLRHAVDRLPHATCDDIATTPVQKMCEHDMITCQNKGRSFKKTVVCRVAMAFACCTVILIVGAGWYCQNRIIDSCITIDVTSSFEITASKNERVLELKPLNDDARKLIKEEDFHGWRIDDAVEALFVQLGEEAYIDQNNHTVLISVNNKNIEHKKMIKQELTQHIQKALANIDVEPTIVYQPMDIATHVHNIV